MNESLHAHVAQAARAKWRATGNLTQAVTAAVEIERQMILDVVDVLAGRADCAHQRELLNRILEIYGRDPVDGPTSATPEHCELEP